MDLIHGKKEEEDSHPDDVTHDRFTRQGELINAWMNDSHPDEVSFDRFTHQGEFWHEPTMA